MRYEKASFEIIEQKPGIEGIFKQIELAGRTCYKSESRITKNSAEKFVNNMIEAGHLAMLEHGTCYLYFNTEKLDTELDKFAYYTLRYNRFSVTRGAESLPDRYITTNLRVLVENFPNDWKTILEEHLSQYIPHLYEQRITVKFNVDRFTGEEFLRHRVFSFARESTRYCNYTKDKFNNEITYIEPCWSVDDKGAHEQLTSALKYAETYYKYLIEAGWKPEQARVVLPCAIKSPLVMTGMIEDWKHFFDLRALGTTGKPHPSAKELAKPLMDKFIKKGWLE